MISQIKRVLSEIGQRVSTLINTLREPLFHTAKDNADAVDQPPEWLNHEDTDFVDEAAWESFPSSDPPAFTRDS